MAGVLILFVLLLVLLYVAESYSKAPFVNSSAVEACLNSESEVLRPTECDKAVVYERSCLRAAVPFRTAYRRVKTCFYCCVEYWLDKSGLSSNMLSHQKKGHFPVGRDPVHNMLVHVRSFSAVSNVYKHRGGPLLRATHNETLGVNLQSFHEFWPAKPATKTIVDYFGDYPVRGMNDKKVLALFADNVADNARKNTIERVLGTGNIDVWEAALDVVGFNHSYPFHDKKKRLIHCCCMALRTNRRQHLQDLHEADATLGCPAVTPKGAAPRCHVGEKLNAFRAYEDVVSAALQNRRGVAGAPTDMDTRYPLSMLHSKFVFSPNGEGEACHRTYEALMAGAVPLVDVSFRKQRRALLEQLPVVMVTDWRSVNADWLEKTWRKTMAKSYDVKVLYMPYWYDHLLRLLLGKAE